MSKCQMKKFMPGGRCGGSSSLTQPTLQSNEVSNAYSNLLASRTQQDNQLFSTQSSTSLVVLPKKESTNTSSQRAKDIDLILSGDF